MPEEQTLHQGVGFEKTDDLIIMNGMSIYSEEIEQTLGSHPGVHDAVVLSLKDGIYQDSLVCAVVLEKNSEATADDLFTFTRERFGASVLYRVVILDDIPRNERGKPVRTELNKTILTLLGRSAVLGGKGKAQPLDQRARDSIEAAGFSEMSVPEKGRLVPLRPIESTQCGGVDEEVTDHVHPENLVTAPDAAKLFSLDVAGIDIISTDISVPWYENGAIINEVNYAPLFGGGRISKRHIPIFLREFMAGDGRIPVNVFVGGERALRATFRLWKALLSKGIHAFLTNERQTFDSSGKPVHMPFISLYRRIRALTLSPKVDAIVMAVQTDEFLFSGLPLEYVDSITVCNARLASFREQDKPLSAERLDAMKHFLADWKKV